jgi:hypothetical protein
VGKFQAKVLGAAAFVSKAPSVDSANIAELRASKRLSP